jgi:hypothetical protein
MVFRTIFFDKNYRILKEDKMPDNRIAIGSDAFILTEIECDKAIEVNEPKKKEFRLTITIRWAEFRQPDQTSGSLWLFSRIGKQTPALPSITAPIQITPDQSVSLLIVSHGAVSVHYTGQAKAHVWLSYYAEFAE